jgi:hypothetical protein
LTAVAAWGGIVVFVGPTFDFLMGNTTEPWVWNQNHATLHFAPGVAGMLGGLLLLAATTRGMERLGGLIALATGVWFVIGPSLEPLWQSSVGSADAIGASGSTTMRVLEAIGYQYGTGAVMVMLAAFALGLLATAPAVVAPAPAQETAPRRRRPRLFRHVSHV